MNTKLVPTLKEAIVQAGLKDGMCVSFHHHLRNGDYVLNMVMEELSQMGFSNLKVNASALHDGHAPLLGHMESGVVTAIETAFIGPLLGKAITQGALQTPVIFRTHGGRPSALATGESVVDVAFIAAPTADPMGNCTGKIGKSACGSLGYAVADAMYAKKVIVLTDNLVPYPLSQCSIPEMYIDYVVEVDAIGDPAGIVSGTTKMPNSPVALKIASYAARAIEASGLLEDGFSFQTGAGGASLATAHYLKEIMLKKEVKGSFALGGITGYLVDMLNEGCFAALQDAQCFDLKAVESMRTNPNHSEISALHYASPTAKSTVAEQLDVVVLGATEIDTQFNVNVHTDSNGYIMGGSGGHSDVAAGAKMTIIVAPLTRKRYSVVVDQLTCLSTPGNTVDLLVTQHGLTVNPLRQDLVERFQQSGLPMVDMVTLKAMAEKLVGIPDVEVRKKERVVAEVIYRDGTRIDRIYQV